MTYKSNYEIVEDFRAWCETNNRKQSSGKSINDFFKERRKNEPQTNPDQQESQAI